MSALPPTRLAMAFTVQHVSSVHHDTRRAVIQRWAQWGTMGHSRMAIDTCHDISRCNRRVSSRLAVRVEASLLFARIKDQEASKRSLRQAISRAWRAQGSTVAVGRLNGFQSGGIPWHSVGCLRGSPPSMDSAIMLLHPLTRKAVAANEAAAS